MKLLLTALCPKIVLRDGIWMPRFRAQAERSRASIRAWSI